MRVDDAEIPVSELSFDLGEGRVVAAPEITPERPAPLARRQAAWLKAHAARLGDGAHQLALTLDVAPFGRVEVRAEDTVGVPAAAVATAPAAVEPPAPTTDRPPPTARHVPYDKDPARDYGADLV